jgi:putative transposase
MYKEKQNLYLDKGYDFPEIENGVIKKGYYPHVRHSDRKSVTAIRRAHHHSSRGRVVERKNQLLAQQGSKLLAIYEKKLENYFALVCLGCILVYRRIIWG